MASFLADLEIVETILGDISAFAAGKTVTAAPVIAGQTYDVSVVLLPSGPQPPYTAITGSFFEIFVLAIGEAEAFSSGEPVLLAQKLGTTWYGITLAKQPPISVAAVAKA